MEFKRYSFKELLSHITDNRGKTCPTADTGLPLIATNCIKDSGLYAVYENVRYVSQETYLTWFRGHPEPEDLLFVCKGSPGRVAWVQDPVPYCIAQDMLAIRADRSKVSPKYLFALLRSPLVKKLIENMHVGTMIPHFKKGDFQNLYLDVPVDMKYQEIAGEIHYKLNEKIELNRQISQTLEQIAQALFKSWFVDFDPVVDNALDAGFFEQNSDLPAELLRRAEQRKAVRQQPDFKPLPVETRQLFPAAFEECEDPSLGLGGWVPKGWGISLAGDELVVKGGSTPSTANPDFWNDGDIHWTSPKDLSGSTEKIMLDTERRITAAGLQKITSGLLPIGSVLMSSRAPIGYLAITKIPVAVNQGYIAIPTSKQLSQEYILYWLNNSVEDIKSIAGGTTFAEISKRTFKSIPLIIPCHKVILTFSELVKGYLDKIAKNVMERSTLEQLRDTLLPKLISGELRLSDDGTLTSGNTDC